MALISIYMNDLLNYEVHSSDMGFTFLVHNPEDPFQFERDLNKGRAFNEETGDVAGHPPAPFLMLPYWEHFGSWEDGGEPLDFWLREFRRFMRPIEVAKSLNLLLQSYNEFRDDGDRYPEQTVRGVDQLFSYSSLFLLRASMRAKEEGLDRNEFQHVVMRNMLIQNVMLYADPAKGFEMHRTYYDLRQFRLDSATF